MHVPFLDLKAQYDSISSDIDAAIKDVISSCSFIKGPFVEKFEREFSSFIGARFCTGVANGTDALFLSLKAIGLNQGDEVITVPNTFISTTEAISLAGGKPVFCEIHEDTCLMKVETLEKYVSEKTRAVIPVHLYGNVADLPKLADFCSSRGITLISDAAQAHGARINDTDLADLSDIVTYSFYPGKNLGAYGDGGAIATNHEDIAQKITMLANHGRIQKYVHEYEGINSRLDGLQAAILSVKLKHLVEWNEKRRSVAKLYCDRFDDIEEVTPVTIKDNVEPVYHLYVIRVPQQHRNGLVDYLNQKDIHTGIHYPVPLPFQPAYQDSIADLSSFEYVKEIAESIISLPIFPEMNIAQVDHVANVIREYFQEVSNV